jgi:hypothetical protein
VSRGWRATVADASLWLRLDLTAAGGVPQRRATDALLRGAAARAGGRLQFLAVDAAETPSWEAEEDDGEHEDDERGTRARTLPLPLR